jgi:creatinine amidohydrolase
MSSHHLAFPGTVDLGPDLVAGFVRAYLATMDRLGVRDVALFSAHGGNFGKLAELVDRYADHERLRVVAFADLQRYLDVMVAAAASTGLEVPATDAHAGGLETSQMLHLHGEERIVVPPGLEGYLVAEEGWLERMAREGLHVLAPNGVLGRPSGATAQAGEAICTALADAVAEWMAHELELELRPAPAAQAT